MLIAGTVVIVTAIATLVVWVIRNNINPFK